jgi:hypothetical protein
VKTSQKLFKLHLKLDSSIHVDLWMTFDAATYLKVNRFWLSTTTWKQSKFMNLAHIQNWGNDVNKHISERKTVVNLSSHVLDAPSCNILEKGLNFAVVPKKIPLKDIISNVEDVIKYQLERKKENDFNVHEANNSLWDRPPHTLISAV